MLTKWGNALGLAAAGKTVTAGGGSTPLGDATVWPNQLLWSDLSSLPAGDLRSGDRCLVTNLGTLGSSGFAQYDGTDWKLVQGVFSSLANLALFTQLVETGAIIAIGTGIETDPYYYYDGSQWLRTPDGVHYIWKNVTDWAGLSALANSLNDDEAHVNTLGYSHSSGIAQKHGGSSWQLLNGKFDSVSDMTAFDTANDVATDAIALVKSGGGHDENSIPYTYRSGNWVRLAASTSGFAWTLTQTELLTGADPSGVGAIKEGDYGIFSASGGPIVVRYKAATPVASGVVGGSQAQWLPPDIYAGTPTIQAYLVGTESVTTDTILNQQGWLTVARTNGTITSQTTRVRLATTAASARVELQTLTANVSSTTKIYARFLYRAVVGNGTTNLATGVYFGEFGDGIGGAGLRPVYYSAVGSNIFFWTGGGVTNSGISGSAQPAPPNLTGTDELMELFYDVSTGISTLRRNGVESAASLRSSSVSVTDRYTLVAFSGTGATQTATIDLSRVMVATW